MAGSSTGYHLFALTPDDGIEEIYASRSGQETCLVDRLFSSSLVAVVTVSAPRYLTTFNIFIVTSRKQTVLLRDDPPQRQCECVLNGRSVREGHPRAASCREARCTLKPIVF